MSPYSISLETKGNSSSSTSCYCCSVTQSCLTLRPHGLQHTRFPCPSTISQRFAQAHVHWVNDAIQPSHPLSSPSPPALNLSQHQGLCIQWPKYWSCSFRISPFNEYLGLISFRIDWFDFLAVQGTLKSLLQHHSSKSSILRHSAFLMVQLPYLYMTTGKTIALTIQTFVKTVMSLLSIYLFFSFIFMSWRLITFQYCSGFCHTLTWISHGFTCIPHPDPPLPPPSQTLWVFPVHQARAIVSCIHPGLVICFTLDNIHVSMLFSWNIPPSPSPTESKSLFYTSVSLFLSCI